MTLIKLKKEDLQKHLCFTPESTPIGGMREKPERYYLKTYLLTGIYWGMLCAGRLLCFIDGRITLALLIQSASAPGNVVVHGNNGNW